MPAVETFFQFILISYLLPFNVLPYTNDTALLSAFQRGEMQAGKVIFDTYFHPLCLFAERITGDMLQSEDIVAETFEKLMLMAGDFASIPRLKSFLYQSVHNAGVNYVIARKRHSAAHEQLRHLAVSDHYDEEMMQNEIMRAELVHEIYMAMDKLPAKCGQIFRMIFVDELSTFEIAGRLHINVQTVRSQKARAIELIKRALVKKNLQFPVVAYLALLLDLP